MRNDLMCLLLLAAVVSCNSPQQNSSPAAGVKPRKSSAAQKDPEQIKLEHEQNQARVDMQLQSIMRKIDIYFYDNGNCPRNLQALTYCNQALHTNCSWRLAEEKLKDPWGNEVVYIRNQLGSRCEVKSLGADGKDGGFGVNQDFVQSGPNVETRKWDLDRDSSKYR